MSCKGQTEKQENANKSLQNHQIEKIDTLSTLALNGSQYGEDRYKVLSLYNLNNDKKYLELLKNDGHLIVIDLPSSEDVKNFSVSNITRTDNGFTVAVNWGGGKYFYKREFSFDFERSQFVLDNVRMSFYTQEDDKEEQINKQISPPIPIQKFKILDYLQNE